MHVPAPLTEILDHVFLKNSVESWLNAVLTAGILFVVLLVVRRFAASYLGKLSARTTNQVDDMVFAMITGTRIWVLALIALLTGMHALDLGRFSDYQGPITRLVILWQAAVWGGAAVNFWVNHHLSHREGSGDRASVAMISAIGVGAKVILWALLLLTTLKSVFNVEITALITGLGVSGIAVALAVQNILGDLLAALAIVFDKPFDVGDAIGVDQISGTVEHIGLKTTRIRSTSGEQIIIGNGDLLKSRLRNYRRMHQRRVQFNLDVPFDTTPDVLARLPGIVEQIIAAQTPVKFDRCHVSSFVESAIRLETVYFVLDPDYKMYMDVQQAIYLELLRRFASEQVKFALPSRTVYHEGPLAKDLAVGPQP
ncbi:MAG TPA: mechanosensitive ion channel domain-containing protein [Gemmatimonadaceae bacterium]|nr:mechanosensitive ion channel domain-containing protein [Gemmatimonadaceae bacterium]